MQMHERPHPNLWHVSLQISVNMITLLKIFHGISDCILRRLKTERLFQAPTMHLAETHTPIPRWRHPKKAYASMLEGFIYKQLHFVMSEDKLQILKELEVTREKKSTITFRTIPAPHPLLFDHAQIHLRRRVYLRSLLTGVFQQILRDS